MREILGFRRFTTPLVIAILFWWGLIFIVDCGFRHRFPRGARAPGFPRDTNRDRDRLDLFRFAFFGGSSVRCLWLFSEATRGLRK